MKCFFDFAFTGLYQNTTPISIGLVKENGQSFYGVFNDFDKTAINDWLKENVINHLYDEAPKYIGPKHRMGERVANFLSPNTKYEMWGDCLAYDWVLFCEMFGSAFNVPINIYYIPFDICTLFKMKGIDPDINRMQFAELNDDLKLSQHNALADAIAIKRCYDKLTGATK